jgi:hypothetical protein
MERQKSPTEAGPADHQLVPSQERSPAAPRADLTRLSTPQLIARLAQDAQNLVKAEIELGKSELRTTLESALATLKRAAAGVILGLMAVGLFVTGAVLALALVIPAWAAALAVGGTVAVASLVAFSLARTAHRGRSSNGVP